MLSSKRKVYYYKISIGRTIRYYLQLFAALRRETIHECIQKTLVKGLIVQLKTRQKFKENSNRALEETETKLRGPL